MCPLQARTRVKEKLQNTVALDKVSARVIESWNALEFVRSNGCPNIHVCGEQRVVDLLRVQSAGVFRGDVHRGDSTRMS
jgi:hypothetical protein